MLKIEGDRITFSSGRTADANRGIVGLGHNMEVSEGFDGKLWLPGAPAAYGGLTVDDIMELSDHMIARWSAFKATLIQQKG